MKVDKTPEELEHDLEFEEMRKVYNNLDDNQWTAVIKDATYS